MHSVIDHITDTARSNGVTTVRISEAPQKPRQDASDSGLIVDFIVDLSDMPSLEHTYVDASSIHVTGPMDGPVSEWNVEEATIRFGEADNMAGAQAKLNRAVSEPTQKWAKAFGHGSNYAGFGDTGQGPIHIHFESWEGTVPEFLSDLDAAWGELKKSF